MDLVTPTDRFAWVVARDAFRIEVRADRSDVGGLLAHALGAHAQVRAADPAEGDGPGWTVRVLASDRYDHLVARLEAEATPQAGDEALARYWRNDFESLRLGRSGGVDAVRHLTPFAAVTLFDGAARTLSYVHPAAEPLYLPHLEHLVTHVLRLDGWARGLVDVHAAFVRYRGKGLAIIGPKRAGKTSLAMHFLARGADLLGSDMAQVQATDRGALEAFSIPHLCRITPETVQDNRWLTTTLGGAGRGAGAHVQGPVHAYGKYEMYDPWLDEMLQRPVGAKAMTVDALLFPRFDAASPRQALVAVPAEEGMGRLLTSIRHDRPLADWLPFDLGDRRRAEAKLEAWAEGSGAYPPSFEFGFGREASLVWDETDAMIDRL